MIEYNFCPKCATKLSQKDGVAYCENCQLKYYQNSKPGNAVWIVKDGKVLMGRRAKEPFKGHLDPIGGFLEYGEDPEAGAIREAKEETGLDIQIIDFLGVYPDTYDYQGSNWATISMHYVAEAISGEEQANDDVASLEWLDINKSVLNEGSDNSRAGFKDLQRWYQKNGQN